MEQGIIYKNKEEPIKIHEITRSYSIFDMRNSENHIERVIGILKKRFPILRTDSIDISAACCVLHNFIRLHNGDMLW
jgi:hypothetical protein